MPSLRAETRGGPRAPARRLALGALGAAAALAVALTLVPGGGGRTYRLRFLDAGQLVRGDDVLVGGRRAGSVRAVALAPDGQAQVTIALDAAYGPLRRGTTAVIRSRSLTGYANRYVALTLGPSNARALPAGGLLPASRTSSPVGLDTVLDALDARTRHSLDEVIHGSAVRYAGKGRQANAAARYLDPALSGSDLVLRELGRDQRTFTDLIVTTSRVAGAVAQRRTTLSALVGHAHAAAHAVAGESAALDAGLARLPGTLRRASTTFAGLRATLGDLGALVAAAKPATRRLAPFLARLEGLTREAGPAVHDLRALIRSGSHDDLLALLRATPALARRARPAFGATAGALAKATPVARFARPYTPDLVGAIRDYAETTANYDANGHYARVQPLFDLFEVGGAGATGASGARVLSPLPPGATSPALRTGRFRRCPGAATAPPPDGSAPYRDAGGGLDCDPGEIGP